MIDLRDNDCMELENTSINSRSTACPRCQYVRKSNELVPDWQCPQCGVAYAKARAAIAKQPANQFAREKSRSFTGRGKGAFKSIQRLLTLLFILSCTLWLLAMTNKGNYPDRPDVNPMLFQEPVQTKNDKQPFVFNYRDKGYEVQPKADYELWGVVVTHNDIKGFMDLTHDKDSVDIKDICVVWGSNLESNDYKQVSYSSGDFTCYFQYGPGVSFDHDRLSNSHLLAEDAAVREKIRSSRIGDQIHLKGMLVNYRPVDQPMNWRNSSLTRKDGGNGACEVVFVEGFDILKAGTPQWYRFYFWMLLLMPVLLIIKLYLFAHETLSGKRAAA